MFPAFGNPLAYVQYRLVKSVLNPASVRFTIILPSTSCLGADITKANAPGFSTRRHSAHVSVGTTALSQSFDMKEYPFSMGGL